jgi:hypothetical protein
MHCDFASWTWDKPEGSLTPHPSYWTIIKPVFEMDMLAFSMLRVFNNL